MRGGSVRIFGVAGIDVRVHVSWLVIFGLVTWSLAEAYYPPLLPGLRAAEAWLLGAVSAILLFASVLVHELAHSLVARSRGVEPGSITLFVFGGVSTLRTDAPRAWTEFVIAIVGPLASFVLAGVSFLLGSIAGEPRLEALFGYLALINGLLGLFNLVPGFPLDGGRVLRALVWNATGDRRRGLETAVAAGQLVGYGFMLWGVIRVLSDDLLGGIWIAAIGWFLQAAGAGSLEQVRVEVRLKGVTVGAVVRPDPTAVAPEVSVEALIDGFLLPGNRRALPVIADGRLVGMVSVSDIQAVPQERRGSTTVADVMGGRAGVITVSPATSLADALTALRTGDFEQLPVMDGDRLIGVLTRADVVRQFELREALGIG